MTPQRPMRFGYTIHYVEDVPATIAFFTAAFGIEPRFITPEADYGELQTGDTTLSFVCHELAQANLDAAGGFVGTSAADTPVGVSITLIADDVAAGVEAAIAAGATSYVDPIEKPWGQTVAYVRTPDGLLIEIATEVQQ